MSRQNVYELRSLIRWRWVLWDCNSTSRKTNITFDIHVKWWTLWFNYCNEHLRYSWWSHSSRLKKDCIEIAAHLLVIERKSRRWISLHECQYRINIRFLYKLKEHFSNALSFWRLDSELIDQQKHRLNDVSLWSHWIKTHSWTWAVQSSNKACLLLNSNEAHHFAWLLHAVLFYYFSLFSS